MLCGGLIVWAPDGTRGWSVFWWTDDLERPFPREVQAIRYAVRIVVDCCLPEGRMIRGSRKRQPARSSGSCGDKTHVKERHRARSLMARNSAERLSGEYDLEPRGSTFSCTRSQHNPSKYLQIWYHAGFKGGGVFALSLVLRIVLEYLTHSFVSSSRIVFPSHGRIEQYSLRVASLNHTHSFIIRSECSFREGCPRELAHSP